MTIKKEDFQMMPKKIFFKKKHRRAFRSTNQYLSNNSRFSSSISASALDLQKIKVGSVLFDNNLLEHFRTQWLLGKWESLTNFSQTYFENNSDRAELALLTAIGHQYQGNYSLSRRYLLLSQKWGCCKKKVLKFLIADIHIILGRRAIHSKQFVKSLNHYKAVLSITGLNFNAKLLSSICTDLELCEFSKHLFCNDRRKLMPLSYKSKIDSFNLDDQFLLYVAKRLTNDDNEEHKLILKELSVKMQAILEDTGIKGLSFLNFITLGKKFWLTHIEDDYIPSKILQNGTFYERKFLDILSSFYRPGSLIVDAGANIGNHTLYFSGILEAEVLAFEPQPHNAFCFRVNCFLNGVEKRVHFERCGLGNNVKVIQLKMAIKNNYGSFTAKSTSASSADFAEGSDAYKIQVCRLDDYFKNTKISSTISILKIDVEGMELEIIEGSLRQIEKNLPLIAVECSNIVEINKIEKILRPYGYIIYQETNWTPTFILLSKKNPFHMRIIFSEFREKSIEEASKRDFFFNHSTFDARLIKSS